MKLAAESTDFLCVKSMGPVPAAQQPRMALAANLNPGISGVCIHSRTRLACSSQPPPLRIRPAWNVYCGNLWSIRTAVAQASRSDECPLPNTREDAVEQACDAIAAQSALKKKKKAKQKTKGFSPTPSVKLSVEIPVRDESIEAVAELANDMVNGLRGRDVEVAGELAATRRVAMSRRGLLDAMGTHSIQSIWSQLLYAHLHRKCKSSRSTRYTSMMPSMTHRLGFFSS